MQDLNLKQNYVQIFARKDSNHRMNHQALYSDHKLPSLLFGIFVNIFVKIFVKIF